MQARDSGGLKAWQVASCWCALALPWLWACNGGSETSRAPARAAEAARPAAALQPSAEARVAALEKHVHRLNDRMLRIEDRLDALERPKPARARATAAPSPAPVAPHGDFDIRCPDRWRQLTRRGDTAWVCRAPEPSPEGLWANCNVTIGHVTPGTGPKAYFDQAIAASPRLRPVRQVSGHATSLGAVPAYEAVYEHALTAVPLRVLATVVVRGDHAYVVSCSAPPNAFERADPAFREITRSFHLTR